MAGPPSSPPLALSTTTTPIMTSAAITMPNTTVPDLDLRFDGDERGGGSGTLGS
jgi:hypothetical protein